MSAAEILEELPHLSAEELRTLVRHAAEWAVKKSEIGDLRDPRDLWLQHLSEQGRRMATGKAGPSIEEIINDIREGR